MTILNKANITPASFASAAQLSKALGSGYGFDVHDIVQADYRAINSPSLLTSLLMSEFDVNSHRTSSFIYDVVNKTQQIPEGKSFTERGKDLDKDDAFQKAFAIPSFGLTWNVLPQDYHEKRLPGGAPGELMTAAYMVGRMQEKALGGWDLLNELAVAKLITDDQNLVSGGPGTQYSFHQEIFGTARPGPVFLDLANVTEMQNRTQMTNLRRQLEQRVGLAGKTMRTVVVICGDTFFQERVALEAQTGLARDLRSSMDLASQRVPEISAGGFTYDSFVGIDGITYIHYGSSIVAGQKLIADDKGYMIPVGVENMLSIELAPAITMESVNQEAQAMYMWVKEDYRQGILAEIESNRLYMNRNPDLIIELDKDAA